MVTGMLTFLEGSVLFVFFALQLVLVLAVPARKAVEVPEDGLGREQELGDACGEWSHLHDGLRSGEGVDEMGVRAGDCLAKVLKSTA